MKKLIFAAMLAFSLSFGCSGESGLVSYYVLTPTGNVDAEYHVSLHVTNSSMAEIPQGVYVYTNGLRSDLRDGRPWGGYHSSSHNYVITAQLESGTNSLLRDNRTKLLLLSVNSTNQGVYSEFASFAVYAAERQLVNVSPDETGPVTVVLSNTAVPGQDAAGSFSFSFYGAGSGLQLAGYGSFRVLGTGLFTSIY